MLGLKTVPCFVCNFTDEEATIVMVDSNIQREELLYSEKAYAYKMKLDALNRQGKRSDLTSDQMEQKLSGKTSRELLADSTNESPAQIQRYIRLTYLITPLMEYVDKKRLMFGAGIELSYLEMEQQEQLCEVMERLCVFPNLAQAKKLKALGKEGKLDKNGMEIILSDGKSAAPVVKLQRKKLNGYFPAGYSTEQMEEVIYGLLERWNLGQGDL